MILAIACGRGEDRMALTPSPWWHLTALPNIQFILSEKAVLFKVMLSIYDRGSVAIFLWQETFHWLSEKGGGAIKAKYKPYYEKYLQ